MASADDCPSSRVQAIKVNSFLIVCRHTLAIQTTSKTNTPAKNSFVFSNWHPHRPEFTGRSPMRLQENDALDDRRSALAEAKRKRQVR